MWKSDFVRSLHPGCQPFGLVTQLQFCDSGEVNFVRSICQAQCSHQGIPVSQRVVLGNTCRPAHLDGPVNDFADGPWSGHFDHCNLLPSSSAAYGVHRVGGFQGQQADLLNGNATFSNPVSYHLLGLSWRLELALD